MSKQYVEWTAATEINGVKCQLAFDAAGEVLGVLVGGYFTAYAESDLRGAGAGGKIDAARREITNPLISLKIHVHQRPLGTDRWYPVEAAVVQVRTRNIMGADGLMKADSYGYRVVNNRTGELLAAAGGFTDAATAETYGRAAAAK